MQPKSDLSGCTIVFDLDGTLVDTAPDLHRALNHVLESIDLPPASLTSVRAHVGQGARRLIERVASGHGVQHSDAQLDALTEQYVEIYASDIAAQSKIFPGVLDTLDALDATGAKMSVCTNKRTALSVQLLDALDLSKRFGAIIGADSVANRKPHAEHFRTAVSSVGGEASSSLMVGDSAADVGTARAAGAPVALVSFGYTDTAPELLGADAVFSHFNQLPELAVRLLGRG